LQTTNRAEAHTADEGQAMAGKGKQFHKGKGPATSSNVDKPAAPKSIKKEPQSHEDQVHKGIFGGTIHLDTPTPVSSPSVRTLGSSTAGGSNMDNSAPEISRKRKQVTSDVEVTFENEPIIATENSVLFKNIISDLNLRLR